MSHENSASKLGRKLLMGVAVGTLPLAGCVLVPEPETPPAGMIQVTAGEKALYEQARAARDAETNDRFIRSYPESELIPYLLSRLPASELSRIPPSTVELIDDDVKDDLPRRVKLGLGLEQRPRIQTSDGDSDGYSG